jgi:hypothetical protein
VGICREIRTHPREPALVGAVVQDGELRELPPLDVRRDLRERQVRQLVVDADDRLEPARIELVEQARRRPEASFVVGLRLPEATIEPPERHLRGRDVDDGDLAAGAQHAHHLVEHLRLVLEVVEREVDDQVIEHRLRVRQLLGAPDHQLHVA